MDFLCQELTRQSNRLRRTPVVRRVVPGHGAPVDREFVMDQRADIGGIAETIRDLAGRGVPLAQALSVGDWPIDPAHLEHAVRRGYEHLPRSQKRLPLI